MSLLTNLIAYWKLDEASGNALDAQGSNTLTDHGTVGSTTGKLGNARDFGTGGSTKYFTIADNADLSTGDIDFTFAAWVQLSATTKGYPTIVAKADSGGGNEEYHLMYRLSNSAFEWAVKDSAGLVRATTFGAAATGTWYHVVCWHDSVNNLVGISVNAGTPDTTSYSLGDVDRTSGFAIGTLGQYVDGSSTWDGLIDEVGFWKRVLTSQERTDLYNAGAGLAFSSFGGGSPTAISGSDAGSGTAAQTLAAAVAGPDAGSGTDGQTLLASPSGSDSGTATDSSILVAAVAGSDAGSGTEGTPTVLASLTPSDAGSGSESSSLLASPSGSDAGTAIEGSTLVVTISASDSGSGADSGSVFAGQSVSGSDSGTATEGASLVVTLSGTEAGTGSDASALVVAISTSETGSGSDAGSVFSGQDATSSDAGSGVESWTLAVVILRSDSGTATEAATATVALASADSGAGSDVGFVVVPGSSYLSRRTLHDRTGSRGVA